MITFNALLSEIQEKHPLIQGIEIKTSDIIFEERIKMNCFYCGKYNNNWKCPPKMPYFDYEKMFSEFDNAALVWLKMPFVKETFDDVRAESSVVLHKSLLAMEEILWSKNFPTALSFIGGSCKLCKNGCGKEQCNNPYKARTPIEATGVNVLKTANKYGISIKFPPEEALMRIGLILW